MKKKAAAKKSKPVATPRVGGTVRGQKQASWPSVGRKRKEQHDPVAGLAKAMKAAREEQRVSISSLAAKLDVAPATLIKFEERNHPVSVGIVLRLAEHLGYSLALKKTPKRK